MTEAAAFCEAHHGRLVGALSLHCGSLDVAEELAQEALERACVHWERVRDMEHPVSWLHQVAFNLSSSRFRRLRAERRATARHGAPVAEWDPDLDAAADVRRAVAQLPPRTRTAVVLRFYADLPVSDVARVMGCAEGTVKSLTSKGVDALRLTLGTSFKESIDG